LRGHTGTLKRPPVSVGLYLILLLLFLILSAIFVGLAVNEARVLCSVLWRFGSKDRYSPYEIAIRWLMHFSASIFCRQCLPPDEFCSDRWRHRDIQWRSNVCTIVLVSLSVSFSFSL
jgi:hypothetical protein